MSHFNCYVPNLRFDFDDLWKEYPLSSFVNRIKRKNIGNISNLPLTISAQHGLIDQQSFFGKKVASSNLENYYLLNRGDFTYNKSYSKDYPWGAIKRLDYYECGVVSNLYICFSPSKSIDSDYLAHYFESDKWFKQISAIAGEGARNHGLLNMSINDFFKTKHYLPSYDEQRKIGRFLNLVEEKIETQNKIISNIQSLIKQINDDVFNKDKNCSMKDCIKELSIRNKDGKINNVLSVSNKLGFIKQSEQFEDKEVASDDKTNYKIVQNETFAYNPARINVGSIALYKKAEDGIVSPMYTCFKSKSGLEKILEMFFKSQSFKKEMNKRLEGSVRMCLTIDAMKNIKFHMPDSQEQKILSLVEKLVEKKILENNLLNTYLKQKEYLLSNLFI